MFKMVQRSNPQMQTKSVTNAYVEPMCRNVMVSESVKLCKIARILFGLSISS